MIGQKGPCLSSLAYCKRLSNNHKVICVSDYLCQNEITLVKAKTLNVAPRWHSKVPYLFYTQFTKNNNRLMSVNLKNRKHNIVASYKGLNMHPSFSPDGTKAVLCFSGGENSELYLYDQTLCKKYGKRIYTKLTNNGGNNISPTLLENDNVIFCSDFQTRLPQIYYLNNKNKKTIRLTHGGYCAAPSYCAKNNNVIYTKVVNHVFQLFIMNFNKKVEKQLTFDKFDKHEPFWSECGNYIIFTFDCKDDANFRVAQIAVLNINSGKIRVLTHDFRPKSYPCWTNKSFFIDFTLT